MFEMLTGCVIIGGITGAMHMHPGYSAGFAALWFLLITAIERQK